MVARDKEYLHELHEKHYGKKKAKKQEPGPTKEESKLIDETYKPENQIGSRANLMAQAKAKGIKNFRILNKTELSRVLDPATIQQDINGIVAEAVIRWKSGFGKRKAVVA